MLRDEESAKDLVQDLFMVIWTKPEQLKPEANLAGYLYISARNRVFNLIEKGITRSDYLKSIAVYAEEASTESMDKLDELLIVWVRPLVAKYCIWDAVHFKRKKGTLD